MGLKRPRAAYNYMKNVFVNKSLIRRVEAGFAITEHLDEKINGSGFRRSRIRSDSGLVTDGSDNRARV